MNLQLIIYNKTRLLAGHHFDLPNISPTSTIYNLKQQIERLTTVPIDAQWLVFGGRLSYCNV
jgi:hypothetical protein